ncbi:MAG: hypothetical protein AAF125_15410 [Chloroflexota bacterium]
MQHVEIQWHDDKQTVLMQYYSNGVTWSDIVAASQEVQATIGAADHPVYTIVDVTELGHIPHGNMMLMRDVMNVEASENVAMTYICISSRLLTRVYETLMKTFSRPETTPIQVVGSVEDALEHIKQSKHENRKDE